MPTEGANLSLAALRWLSRSPNHRMVEVGRGIWRSSCPSPSLKQGQSQRENRERQPRAHRQRSQRSLK